LFGLPCADRICEPKHQQSRPPTRGPSGGPCFELASSEIRIDVLEAGASAKANTRCNIMLALAIFSLSVALPVESNIVDLAVATPDLSTLVTALKAADLVDTLSGPGPFTVFAPTNAAFSKLPEATLNSLLEPKNKAALVDVLTYHVVAGRAIHAADFFAQQKVLTVDGKAVEVVKDKSGVHINNAAVTTADVGASNGVVHIIDAVLIPPGFVPPTPTTGCTGASTGLAADQCAAWGEFWDDAGGPNWGGKGKDCLKSDPCACRSAVSCSGGSITEM
jgi:uncharacterized surface protein with fasciclin (FAS1) repeats